MIRSFNIVFFQLLFLTINYFNIRKGLFGKISKFIFASVRIYKIYAYAFISYVENINTKKLILLNIKWQNKG